MNRRDFFNKTKVTATSDTIIENCKIELDCDGFWLCELASKQCRLFKTDACDNWKELLLEYCESEEEKQKILDKYI